MADFRRTPPPRFWCIAALLTVWSAIGCYACYLQFRLGAAAMGPASAYDRALHAALPRWYDWIYALAVGAGLFGGIALLARSKRAEPLFLVSLVAVLAQFGYLFATTDIVAHKGLAQTAAFPTVIVALSLYAWWFGGNAKRRRWLD